MNDNSNNTKTIHEGSLQNDKNMTHHRDMIEHLVEIIAKNNNNNKTKKNNDDDDDESITTKKKCPQTLGNHYYSRGDNNQEKPNPQLQSPNNNNKNNENIKTKDNNNNDSQLSIGKKRWQTDTDLPIRREMVLQIVDTLIKDKNAHNSMAVKLEFFFYLASNSLEAYLDMSTLSRRIRDVATGPLKKSLQDSLQSNNKKNSSSNDKHQQLQSFNKSNNYDDNNDNHDGNNNHGTSSSLERKEFRYKQRKCFLILSHFLQCSKSNKEQRTVVTHHFAEMKEFLKHMKNCKDRKCTVTDCYMSRKMMHHCKECKFAKCSFCSPIKEELRNVYRNSKTNNNDNSQKQQADDNNNNETNMSLFDNVASILRNLTTSPDRSEDIPTAPPKQTGSVSSLSSFSLSSLPSSCDDQNRKRKKTEHTNSSTLPSSGGVKNNNNNNNNSTCDANDSENQDMSNDTEWQKIHQLKQRLLLLQDTIRKENNDTFQKQQQVNNNNGGSFDVSQTAASAATMTTSCPMTVEEPDSTSLLDNRNPKRAKIMKDTSLSSLYSVSSSTDGSNQTMLQSSTPATPLSSSSKLPKETSQY